MAKKQDVKFLGAETWAFEFENQPPFEGFRELATNGIDKSVLNAFRTFGLLGRARVKATSSEALPPDYVVRTGVRRQPANREGGVARLQFALPRQGLSLVRLAW